jgi:hypothetical protein
MVERWVNLSLSRVSLVCAKQLALEIINRYRMILIIDQSSQEFHLADLDF